MSHRADGGAQGAHALGFRDGQLVEREPYDLLFGQCKAPDGTRLGKPPSSARAAADVYAQLVAAEAHATEERRRELRVEAATQARQSPLYFDLTISFSKSISIFHASLGENARLAQQAGDAEGQAYWAGLPHLPGVRLNLRNCRPHHFTQVIEDWAVCGVCGIEVVARWLGLRGGVSVTVPCTAGPRRAVLGGAPTTMANSRLACT